MDPMTASILVAALIRSGLLERAAELVHDLLTWQREARDPDPDERMRIIGHFKALAEHVAAAPDVARG